MEISTIELRKLKASEGMILTNGEAYLDPVYLGVNDTADNWHEISMEEYASILEAEESRDGC